jgi:hypothetical protein
VVHRFGGDSAGCREGPGSAYAARPTGRAVLAPVWTHVQPDGTPSARPCGQGGRSPVAVDVDARPVVGARMTPLPARLQPSGLDDALEEATGRGVLWIGEQLVGW